MAHTKNTNEKKENRIDKRKKMRRGSRNPKDQPNAQQPHHKATGTAISSKRQVLLESTRYSDNKSRDGALTDERRRQARGQNERNSRN